MTSWIENKLGRSLDWSLAALQIVTIGSVVGVLIFSIALYHHYSDDYIVNFADYLLSIKIAIPPIAVFFSTYVVALLTGSSISEAPKLTVRFVRNNFLQHNIAMVTAITCSIAIMMVSAYIITMTTPPKYAEFVAQLLGGESDNFAVFKGRLNQVKSKNKVRADQFETALAVFEERRRWNMESSTISVIKPRIFVRTLEANVSDESWKQHPLRKHALAEAYSMWSQAALHMSENIDVYSDKSSWGQYATKSLELYEDVASSSSRWATPLLSASAMNNKGNIYLYSKKYEQAFNLFSNLLAQEGNLSTAGNLLVTLIKLNRPKEVLSRGEEIIKWSEKEGTSLLEPSAYAGVIEAMGYAHLLQGDLKAALPKFRETYEIMNDTLSKQNLALVYALSGNREIARHLLLTIEGFAEITSDNLNEKISSGKQTGCTALILGIVKDNEMPTATPYFLAYVREPQSPDEIAKIMPDDFDRLKVRVADTLRNDQTPCGDLYQLPSIKERLGISSTRKISGI